jgi:PAS domain S-box-containing protein
LNYENRDARLVAIHDITDRKLVEDDLHRTKLFLDTVIEHVPMPIVVKTAKDSRFTLLNRAGEEHFGFCREDVIGKTPQDVFEPARADTVLALDREATLSDQPIISYDHLFPRPNGVPVLSPRRRLLFEEATGNQNIF